MLRKYSACILKTMSIKSILSNENLMNPKDFTYSTKWRIMRVRVATTKQNKRAHGCLYFMTKKGCCEIKEISR